MSPCMNDMNIVCYLGNESIATMKLEDNGGDIA